MRNATAILLVLWVSIGAAAQAGHVRNGKLPAAQFFPVISDWESIFGAPVPFDDPPPECALTGHCVTMMRSRIPCVEKPGCATHRPIFAGQGQVPRGYTLGKGGTSNPVATANIPVPPSATLLLGALLAPLLLPRRTRRRRQ